MDTVIIPKVLEKFYCFIAKASNQKSDSVITTGSIAGL